MSIKATVLFGLPQNEIASLLTQRIATANSVKIVVGFVTIEGVKAVEDALDRNSHSIHTFVLGAGTYRAFEAFDDLIARGINSQNLFVHLGHTRLTKEGAKHAFYRYHPMLHSKIYYMEYSDGTACAVVGSHNFTGFALKGLNGEASIMIEGDKYDPEFEKVRTHINTAQSEAIHYQSHMKDAYAWWTNQYIQGLESKTDDIPKDSENKKTIIIFAESTAKPRKNEILYFELPEALGKIQSLRAEVHLFIFDVLPPSPADCLGQIHKTKYSFWCSIEGIENNKGGKELKADWYISDQNAPRILQTSSPFRPSPKPEMQQIRVKLNNAVFGKFDYLFGKQSQNWIPELNEQLSISYDEQYTTEIQKLGLIPKESDVWFSVVGLTQESGKKDSSKSKYELALKSLEPDAGSYLLFSTGRRAKE